MGKYNEEYEGWRPAPLMASIPAPRARVKSPASLVRRRRPFTEQGAHRRLLDLAGQVLEEAIEWVKRGPMRRRDYDRIRQVFEWKTSHHSCRRADQHKVELRAELPNQTPQMTERNIAKAPSPSIIISTARHGAFRGPSLQRRGACRSQARSTDWSSSDEAKKME